MSKVDQIHAWVTQEMDPRRNDKSRFKDPEYNEDLQKALRDFHEYLADHVLGSDLAPDEYDRFQELLDEAAKPMITSRGYPWEKGQGRLRPANREYTLALEGSIAGLRNYAWAIAWGEKDWSSR